jgi:hypothetical protein
MRKIAASKKGRVAITGAVALGTIFTGIVMSLPAGAAAETLKYNIHFQTAEFYEVDADDSGSKSAGDYEAGEFVLDKGGDAAGAFEFVCTRTAAEPKRDQCVGTAKIRGRGMISAQGVQRANGEKFVASITGGTGEFENAGGTLYLNFSNRVSTATFRISN